MNLLNAGKMELLKSKANYKEALVPAQEEGQPDLPRSVEDVDKVDLGSCVTAADPKLFPKLLKAFETSHGLKMRKINKTQTKNLY
jgi:hypothetical protein